MGLERAQREHRERERESTERERERAEKYNKTKIEQKMIVLRTITPIKWV